ncbi:hypothetical protein OR16_41284 [Cupriavidus basilensis OR16]|uniref:Uncharacterized protein n=1 Tax=Cupriavidus basilensis OR16 TaxID=1127483 RepID=H1SID6_9BURK|nr:hypothetical protein [Cupriavidus basilensis]EHP37721.1 hypothetical protein OR16_41284 [Cupriavidus basilensis OR16]
MLHTPAMVNVFDGRALAAPCHEAGAAPGLIHWAAGNAFDYLNRA